MMMIQIHRPPHGACVSRAPAGLVASLCLLSLQVAAEPARIAVLSPQPADPSSAATVPRFQELLLQGLQARGPGVQALGPGRTAKGQREAAEAFLIGMQQLEALQFETASVALAHGVEVALSNPATTDFPAVRQALVQLAVARFRLRKEADARASLLELFRLEPSYVLPPGRYAPAFLTAVEKARLSAERLPAGTLHVEGPEGWRAGVDGRPLSPLPADFSGLRRGLHFLRAEGPSGEARGLRVDVKVDLKAGGAGAVTQARIDPADTTPSLEVLPSVTPSLGERLDAYCQSMGADFALVTMLREGGDGFDVGAALYSVKDHGFEALPALHLDAALARAPEEIAQLVERLAETVRHFGPLTRLPFELLSRPGAMPSNPRLALREPWVPPTAPLSAATASPPSSPGLAPGPLLWAEVPWWVWVAGGAVAVGITGATVYGVSQARRPGTGTVTATW